MSKKFLSNVEALGDLSVIGSIVAGRSTPLTVVGAQKLQAVSGAASAFGSLVCFSTTTSHVSDLQLATSASDTIGTHAPLPDNRIVGRVSFVGSDGTSFNRGAYIEAVTSGAWSGSNNGTDIRFSTVLPGSVVAAATRMTLLAHGQLSIGTNAQSAAPTLSITSPAKLRTAAGAYTDTVSTAGTKNHAPIVAFDAVAISAAVAGVIYTNASTLYIDGPPTASTNVTITNPYAIYINTGAVRLNGPITLNTSQGTAGQVLTSAGAGAVPTWETPTGGSGPSLGLVVAAAAGLF